MKKLLVVLLILSLSIAFVGCGEDSNAVSKEASSVDATNEAEEASSKDTALGDDSFINGELSDEESTEGHISKDEPSAEESKDSSFTAEVLSDKVYTVYLINNNDGTYTVNALLPKGVSSGKIVVSTSESLSLVSGSLATTISANAINEDYDRDGVVGACVAFAATANLPEGTVALTATYTAADGANISEKDITVPDWNLTSGANRISSNETDKVIIKYVSK